MIHRFHLQDLLRFHLLILRQDRPRRRHQVHHLLLFHHRIRRCYLHILLYLCLSQIWGCQEYWSSILLQNHHLLLHRRRQNRRHLQNLRQIRLHFLLQNHRLHLHRRLLQNRHHFLNLLCRRIFFFFLSMMSLVPE